VVVMDFSGLHDVVQTPTQCGGHALMAHRKRQPAVPSLAGLARYGATHDKSAKALLEK
jgi:hypothetical protein